MIRAIQFSAKRVGSTFLQNAIDSHPDLVGIDEVFVNMAKKPGMRKSGFVPYLRSDITTPKEYIEDIIYKTYPNKNTIFKLMYNQIAFHDGLMDYISKNKIPMIYLMRKNLVKQVISGMTAARTDHKPINISGKNLLDQVRQLKKLNNYWKKKLNNHIKLVLFYEDIIGDVEEDKTYLSNNANVAVCDFFKVKQIRMFATTKKKNKEDLNVYLPNFGEIKKVFKNTEFEWMLK